VSVLDFKINLHQGNLPKPSRGVICVTRKSYAKVGLVEGAFGNIITSFRNQRRRNDICDKFVTHFRKTFLVLRPATQGKGKHPTKGGAAVESGAVIRNYMKHSRRANRRIFREVDG